MLATGGERVCPARCAFQNHAVVKKFNVSSTSCGSMFCSDNNVEYHFKTMKRNERKRVREEGFRVVNIGENEKIGEK